VTAPRALARHRRAGDGAARSIIGEVGMAFGAGSARRFLAMVLLVTAGLAGPAAAQDGGAALAAQAQRNGLTGSVGFVVMDAATGETLEALEPDTPLAPASVAKAPTALFALHVLGAHARFATEIVAAGALRDGRLAGDLALRGGGDPTLDSDGLAALAAQARARVGAVEGGFVVDPGPGPTAAAIDPQMREEAAYNPSVSTLNLNFNRVLLEWTRPQGELRTRLAAHAERWSPDAATVALALAPPDCACPNFDHLSDGAGETWRVRGAALSGEGSVWLPVRDPAPYAAAVFRAAAADRGLALPAPRFGPAPDGAVVARRESAPVADLVEDMLRYSTNLTAEALGLAAARAIGAEPADLAASGAAMAAWFAGYAGIPRDDPGFRFANHSGLSADSRVSPRRMAQVFAAALKSPPPGPGLPDLLRPHPIDEDRASAPKGTAVHAKTGTLDFARGLGGYLTTASGRRLVFAYFANDLSRRRPGEDRPDGAIPWRNRAVTLERALLRSWAARFDG
jgi:D-alanyl-D-alanine carboxypeptidase/D-alanyl-D-alanine-endopeptidase (penicillin-binding protein 4)